MKAKIIKENIRFQRTGDSKKSLGVGVVDHEGYVKQVAEKYGLDPDRFWEEWGEVYSDQSSNDIKDELLEILKKTPLEYQIEWIKGPLEFWIEDINGIEIEEEN